MKRTSGVATILVGVFTLFAAPAWAQTAASIVEVGWWTRQPRPSPAPAGGFEVARTPDGDFSVAALRVRIDASVLTKAILILNESGGVRQEGAILKVCPTSAAWSSANPGQMSAAPLPGCDRASVRLQRDSNAGRWTGDVRSPLSGGENPASLMILPDPPPPNPLPDPGFTIQFSSAQLAAEGRFDEPSKVGTLTAPGGSGPSIFSLGSGFSTPPDQIFTPSEPTSTGAYPSEESSTQASTSLGEEPPRRGGRGEEIPWARLLLVIPGSAVLGGATAGARRWLMVKGWIRTIS